MTIFIKENGTSTTSNIPFKLKKFFDMSKTTKSNLILQRSGAEKRYVVDIKLFTKYYNPLG